MPTWTPAGICQITIRSRSGRDHVKTRSQPGRDQVGDKSDPATVEFINAGHRLGSASARVRIGDRTILFGGDLGRYGRPVLPDPSPVPDADVLLLGSARCSSMPGASTNWMPTLPR